MRRPLALRAAAPLLATTLAVASSLVLAASLVLGVQAGQAPLRPTTPVAPQDLAQVEGVTTVGGATVRDASVVDTGTATAASAIGLAVQGLGWANSGPSAQVQAAPKTAPKPTAAPTRTATTKSTAVWWSRYHGTNHVWMPTLGLSKPIYFYACDRTTYPANVVYQWGCGGTNNVYLFGHNFGTFNPLYEAWLHHTLRKGMPVVYADGQGRTHLYRVTTWRVVDANQGSWAYASQPVPSMTLQTCSAISGSGRLVVRLVAARS